MHQSLPFEAYGRGSARCRGASGGERRASQKLRCLFFSTRLCFLFATPERESLTGVAAISRLRGFGAQCLPETSAFSTGWLDARVLLLTGKAEEETRERGGAEAASSNESILMKKALPQAFSISLSLSTPPSLDATSSSSSPFCSLNLFYAFALSPSSILLSL